MQGPNRGQCQAASLRNTNRAKTRSFPELTEKFSPIFLSAALFLLILSFHGWMKQSTEDSQGCHSLQVHLGCPAEMGSFAHRTLTSVDPTDSMLLSLAGAAGDKGLPWLCPRRDRAAGGSIHHVHPPGGTSDFCEEETEEGKCFNRGMKMKNPTAGFGKILPPSSVTGCFWKTASNHYL